MRAIWHEQFEAICPSRLVFVDESGANTQLTRLRGRALTSQRLLGRISHRHYTSTTLISGGLDRNEKEVLQ